MKALMSLQEEQEEYILKTEREKQELKQEMENKSRALDEAQRQLEEVRANRHRVDQDVVVSGEKRTPHTLWDQRAEIHTENYLILTEISVKTISSTRECNVTVRSHR